MTDFYSQNRCVCSTRSHGPLLCAFCLSFHFKCTVYHRNEARYNTYNYRWCAPISEHLREGHMAMIVFVEPWRL